MNKIKIIAEIGPNHNGKLSLAKKLILSAQKAGADYVKFQTFLTEDVITEKVKKANYQIRNSGTNETQFQMLEKLQLSFSDFHKIHNFCKKIKIKFLTTAFDLKSLQFVKPFNMDYYKIPSGEITNAILLKKIGSFNKKTILSTGMSTLIEVGNAVKLLIKSGLSRKKLTILHCNSDYPTNLNDVNMNVLKTLSKYFKVDVGYSDHTMSINVPVVAAALGATIIEKHFTLDRNMSGPDHKMSLEPNEFEKMVLNIRDAELILGKSKKEPTKSELKNIKFVRRSIVAQKNIKKGEKFTIKNISVKRPGTGINPMKFFENLNKRSKKNYLKDELI